ncbi:MAG TPA: metallophosphoesterase [bacterium]|nr:metallophosphoesterase [bacterium]
MTIYRGSIRPETLLFRLILLLICAGTVCAGPTRIALLGDRTGTADQKVFDQVISEIMWMHPDLVINVGDLIEGPQPDEAAIQAQWDLVTASLERLRCPVYCVPGNNDIFDEASRRIYPDRTGKPAEYSFDVNGIHVVVLDNSEMNGWDELPEARRAWLEADLAAAGDAAFIIVVFHKPFWVENFTRDRPDPLHPLFVRYGVDRVFSGHYHRYLSTEKDGIRYTMIGSSGGHVGDNPYRGEYYHYGWLTVDGEQSSLAVLKHGAAAPETWLTLDHWVSQESLEECLLTLNRPRLTDSGRCAVSVRMRGGCEAVSGWYRWDLSGGNWVISPSAGRFDVMDADRRLDFAAMVTGSRYPLPRFRIGTELDGRDYETARRLCPVVSARVGRAGGEVTPDGEVTEAAWHGDDVAVIREFGGQDGEVCPTDPVEIRMVRTGDRLAVAVTARTGVTEVEPGGEPVSNPAPERDGPVFMDDCVYLMFWSGPDYREVTQIIVNSRGGVLDQKGQVPETGEGRPEMDRSWNGTFDMAVTRAADMWSAELIIPVSDLGMTGPGSPCRFNALRYQPERQALSAWMVPATFDPEDAGRLELAE